MLPHLLPDLGPKDWDRLASAVALVVLPLMAQDETPCPDGQRPLSEGCGLIAARGLASSAVAIRLVMAASAFYSVAACWAVSVKHRRALGWSPGSSVRLVVGAPFRMGHYAVSLPLRALASVEVPSADPRSELAVPGDALRRCGTASRLGPIANLSRIKGTRARCHDGPPPPTDPAHRRTVPGLPSRGSSAVTSHAPC